VLCDHDGPRTWRRFVDLVAHGDESVARELLAVLVDVCPALVDAPGVQASVLAVVESLHVGALTSSSSKAKPTEKAKSKKAKRARVTPARRGR
jgi:hypothetical protein